MNRIDLALHVIEMRHILTHLYQKLFHDLLRQYEMTQLEVDILLFLANNPDYDTAADLVKKRHLTKSHVSKSIDDLVKKGLIKRHYYADNHKVIHLRLTKASELIIAQGREIQNEFTQIIHQNISKQDMNTASMVLQTLVENAESELKNRKEEN